MYAVRLAALAAILLTSSTAFAAETCKGGPRSQWKSAEQVRKAAADHGFGKVVKVIIEDGCYEAVTLNAEGKIVGAQFDPVTLKLEKVEEPR